MMEAVSRRTSFPLQLSAMRRVSCALQKTCFALERWASAVKPWLPSALWHASPSPRAIADLDYAARLVVEGGRLGPVQRVGAPQGTSVKVEELFYNVPARLKFLKSDITERHHIDNLVTRYALAYPMVRMQLHQDGKPILRTSGNDDRREILAAVYGIDLAKQMMEVYSETDGITITGFISPISLTRSNRREITLFVNGRPVQDVAITSAVIQAYHTMLMVGRYPMAILFIQLPSEDVDVNVHPAKAEVRFQAPSQVFSAVQNAVRRALLAHTPVPGVEMPGMWIRQAAEGSFARDDGMGDTQRNFTPDSLAGLS